MLGARTKVQANAKLDQISDGPTLLKTAVQDMRLEVWSRCVRSETTELGCYGLAPVLKQGDDKSDYNFAIFVIFRCSLLL